MAIMQTPPILTISFNEGDIYKIIVLLDPSKTKGIDNISPLLLKHCAIALSSPLHHLFKTSIAKGSIPTEWRTHL